LLVAVRPLFSPANYQFREDGQVVGDMEGSWWRETAELDLDDGRYSFYRDQVIGGDYVISHKGQILARATCKDRSSVGLDRARPRLSFLALLADVETATRLDDPD
jgi:hypothetical protein